MGAASVAPIEDLAEGIMDQQVKAWRALYAADC
jgi:hypothetical protein